MSRFCITILSAIILSNLSLDASSYVGRDGQLYYDVNPQSDDQRPAPPDHRESYENNVIYDSRLDQPDINEELEEEVEEDRPIGPQYFPAIKRDRVEEIEDEEAESLEKENIDDMDKLDDMKDIDDVDPLYEDEILDLDNAVDKAEDAVDNVLSIPKSILPLE